MFVVKKNENRARRQLRYFSHYFTRKIPRLIKHRFRRLRLTEIDLPVPGVPIFRFKVLTEREYEAQLPKHFTVVYPNPAKKNVYESVVSYYRMLGERR